ncbi:MAG: hypothetical protein MK193_03555 [Lentisphaeria bacterium]|nr:hypothetical protein [Lentisphaeria bacterium]
MELINALLHQAPLIGANVFLLFVVIYKMESKISDFLKVISVSLFLAISFIQPTFYNAILPAIVESLSTDDLAITHKVASLAFTLLWSLATIILAIGIILGKMASTKKDHS